MYILVYECFTKALLNFYMMLIRRLQRQVPLCLSWCKYRADKGKWCCA